jgi:hypothetical protein
MHVASARTSAPTSLATERLVMSSDWQKFLAFALLSTSAAAQSTWYVDVHAIPPGNGTAANPYASIQYGINQPTTAWNDTLLVAPGLYVENVTDWPTKRVRVRSSGGPLVTELRSASQFGAAVEWQNGSTIEGFTVTNSPTALSLVVGNAVRCVVRDNPGLAVFSDVGLLRECTIVDNHSGVSEEFFGRVVLRNTIVWNNELFDFDFGAYAPDAYYCAGGLPQGTTGTGNVVGDPLLWNATGSHHLLRPGSPCIDAGDPNSPLDPDGSRADIGAVPYDSSFAPGPVTFCTAKVNSDGCTPQIAFAGHATANGTAPFVVSAVREVAGKSGLLFYGPGQRAQPFQGGLHCVQLPTKRVGAQLAAGAGPCGGTFTFDFGAYLAAGAHPLLFPGAVIACQWWSRDPLDPSGFGTALSDALFFGVAP